MQVSLSNVASSLRSSYRHVLGININNVPCRPTSAAADLNRRYSSLHRSITVTYRAIVDATGRSDRRGDRRRDYRQLVARLNRCSSPRRSPVVYTRGDCRDDRRESRLVYTLD